MQLIIHVNTNPFFSSNMLLSSNQNTQLPKLIIDLPMLLLGAKFLHYSDHKNQGVNCTTGLFGNIYIFCKVCKNLKEKQSEVVTLRCWGHGDHQNKVGFSQSFTLAWHLGRFDSLMLWMVANLPTWQNWKTNPTPSYL